MRTIKKGVKKLVENTFSVDITKRPKSYSKKSNFPFVNESVNFEKEVIFVAIPKTGTNSVRNQLNQNGIPEIDNPHLNILQIRTLIYVTLLKESLGTNKTFPNNERQSDAAIRKRADDIFNSFFKFSAVRNPWARAVSLYYRREGILMLEKMTFDEFCDSHIYASDTCLHPTMHKNQYDWLSDEKGELLVDYVYKLENFESAIIDIKNLTNGRLELKNLKRNHNPNSKSTDYRNLYNDKTRKIIEKRFEKDISHFEYTF